MHHYLRHTNTSTMNRDLKNNILLFLGVCLVTCDAVLFGADPVANLDRAAQV